MKVDARSLGSGSLCFGEEIWLLHHPFPRYKLLGYRSKAGFNGIIKNLGLLFLVRLCEFPSSLVHVMAHNYCIVLSELSEQQSSRENASKWSCLRRD